MKPPLCSLGDTPCVKLHERKADSDAAISCNFLCVCIHADIDAILCILTRVCGQAKEHALLIFINHTFSILANTLGISFTIIVCTIYLDCLSPSHWLILACFVCSITITWVNLNPVWIFLPASRAQSTWPAGPKITLRFPCLLVYIYIYLCVRTYHVRNNYITYIVAMWPYFSRLRQFRPLLCVAAMSSLPQLRLWDGCWEAEASRRNDARLTESGNARSKLLNTRGAYRVAIQQSFACLSGSECRRPGWFLDMKYQPCCTKSLHLLKEWNFSVYQSDVVYTWPNYSELQ